MSFAFNAAPFNNNENNSESSSIERKRNAKNKTIKRRQPPSQINILKEKLTGMDNDDEDLANFDPPPPPTSMGANRTKRDPVEDIPVQPHSKSMFSDGPVQQEAFQNLPSLASEDYYKQFVPYYDRTNTGTISNNELTQKLDYMIHMLEEQQDLKTNHVTEEVILYSFLGVFMIFVLDSFARAGKYVR